jgi:ubiquinone/menaquinone biosynthesis C-methylase UbiE
MSEDKVFHGVERLRSPERLAALEVDKVVMLALQGILAKTVLDVGTGSGVFAGAFAERKLSVTGIDIQEEMLAAARTLVPKAKFQLVSSEELPFLDASFDLVFMGVVLHETKDPLKAVKEAFRVCALRTAVLEWPYDEGAKAGPPQNLRLKAEEIAGFADEAGFARTSAIHLANLILYVMEK